TAEAKKPFLEAVKFVKKVGAKMHLVYVNTTNSFLTTMQAEEMMANFIAETKPRLAGLQTNLYNDISVETGILNFSQSVNADLIGMGTHGRKGLAHFFNGSISEDLVNHAKRPVITFKI